MTGLIPIVALGTLVLILGARLVVQRVRIRHAYVVTIDDFSGARAGLDSLFREMAVIKRMFAADDMEFISQTAAPDVKRFFLSERKTLAIQWLRMTKKQVRELMNLHLKLASYANQPSPRYEFGLAVDYLRFLLVSHSLMMLLWLRGPFDATKAINFTLHGAERFCSVFSIRLEKVDPVKLGAGR